MRYVILSVLVAMGLFAASVSEVHATTTLVLVDSEPDYDDFTKVNFQSESWQGGEKRVLVVNCARDGNSTSSVSKVVKHSGLASFSYYTPDVWPDCTAYVAIDGATATPISNVVSFALPLS